MTDGLDEAAQTATEHVAASAANPSAPGAKARPSRKATLRPDVEPGHCTNCGTKLEGPVCHHCGQLADEFHRPVRGLLGELIEGFFALDGRVARTIPNLLWRPGYVTRSYLKGQRARFMPPFRLYIIASLAFFLLAPFASGIFQAPTAEEIDGVVENANYVGPESLQEFQDVGEAIEAGLQEGLEVGIQEGIEAGIQDGLESGDLTPEEVEAIQRAAASFGFPILDGQSGEVAPESSTVEAVEPQAITGADPPETEPLDADGAGPAAPETESEPSEDAEGDERAPFQIGLERGDGDTESFGIGDGEGSNTAREIRRFMVPEEFGEPAPENSWDLETRTFVADRASRLAEDPGRWFEEAAEWVPRIMFVMVPIYALLLSLTYAWRRGFFLYDHLIVSVHFHAALFLSMTVAYLASYVLPSELLGLAWIIYSHFYLYKLHRVVYERGRFVSILRTLALSFVYGILMLLALGLTLLLGALSV